MMSSNTLVKVKAVSIARLVALDEMTREEFDAKMARGITQAKAGEGIPVDEFFDSVKRQ